MDRTYVWLFLNGRSNVKVTKEKTIVFINKVLFFCIKAIIPKKIVKKTAKPA